MATDWDRPPEFDSDGSPPPLRTELRMTFVDYDVRTTKSALPGDPLALRTLLRARPSNPDFDPARDWLVERLSRNKMHRVAARDTYRLNQAHRGFERFRDYSVALDTLTTSFRLLDRLHDALHFSTYTGLLRTRRSSFWQRMQVIQQVARGDTKTITDTVESGLSTTDTQELSQSLGLEYGKKDVFKLSTQLSQKFGTSVTQSEQRSHSTELELSGPVQAEARYRHYALWHYGHRLDVDLLVISSGTLAWRSEIGAEFFDPESLTPTYFEAQAS
jgi:hypothetical protein